MTTRREFVSASSSTLIASLLGPMTLFAGTETVRAEESNLQLFPGVPLHKTKQKAWELLNSPYPMPFYIHYDEQNLIEAQLVRVQNNRQTELLDEYSLVFESSWEPVLKAGSYRVEHPELGMFVLYLTPAATSNTSHGYEAIVNRLVHGRRQKRRVRRLSGAGITQ